MANESLKLRQTTVTEGDPLFVEIVLADADDLEQATETVGIRVHAEALSGWSLGQIQRVALQRVQTALDAEIRAALQRLDQVRS